MLHGRLTFKPVLLSLLLSSVALAAPPTPLNIGQNSDARQLDLMLDIEDLPWVAWVEHNPDTNKDDLFVKRFDGAQWVQAGGRINTEAKQSAQTPMLRRGENGDIWIGWTEERGDGDIYEVSHWDGENFVYDIRQRQGIDLSHAARSRSLGVEMDGTPVLSWSVINKMGVDGIRLEERRWQNGDWAELPQLDIKPGQSAVQSSLVVGKNNKKAVVWTEGNAAASNVWVKVNKNGSWEQLGNTPLNVRPLVYVATPVIKLDTAGRPVVAWLEENKDGILNLFARRWNGQNWMQLGGNLNIDPQHWAVKPSLAVDARGRVWLAWTEEGEDHRQVYVKVWDGKKWHQLGKSMNLDPQKDAHSPVLGIDGEDRVHLAWIEQNGNNHQVFVRELSSTVR